MPITNNGTFITRAINWAEPYAVLGLVPVNGWYDPGTVNASQLINKWAKNKPIRYNKIEALTDLERAGTINDRASGIFYGLKLANVGGQIETMHEAAFEYQRVRPGVDVARYTDWEGYDHLAKPNPIGTLPEVIYLDIDYASGVVDLFYDTYNTTGVNLSDVISSMSSSGTNFKDFYPCVLVTIGNNKYVRALWNMSYDLQDLDNSSRKYRGYTTFYHNNTWARQWALLTDGLPGAAEGKSITATVFFQRSIGVGNGGVAGDPDFREWQAVNSLVVMNTGYACPEAVAKTIQLKNFMTKGLDITGGLWSKSTSGVNYINVGLNAVWVEPTPGVTYTFTGTIYDSNNEPVGSISQDFGYYPDLMLWASWDVALSLFLIPETTVFTLSWKVVSSARPSKPCNSGHTTLAYQNASIIS